MSPRKVPWPGTLAWRMGRQRMRRVAHAFTASEGDAEVCWVCGLGREDPIHGALGRARRQGMNP